MPTKLAVKLNQDAAARGLIIQAYIRNILTDAAKEDYLGRSRLQSLALSWYDS